MSWVTVTELAEWVGVPDTRDHAMLSVALTAAHDQVRAICGRSFELVLPSAETRIFVAQRRDVVWVDDLTVAAGMTVVVDADRDGTAEVTVPAADLELSPPGRRRDGRISVWDSIVHLRHGWPVGVPVIHVTARWGWDSIPDQVRVATLELAKDVFQARMVRGGVTVTEFGPTSVRANRTVRMLLDPFIRWDRVGIV